MSCLWLYLTLESGATVLTHLQTLIVDENGLEVRPLGGEGRLYLQWQQVRDASIYGEGVPRALLQAIVDRSLLRAHKRQKEAEAHG